MDRCAAVKHCQIRPSPVIDAIVSIDSRYPRLRRIAVRVPVHSACAIAGSLRWQPAPVDEWLQPEAPAQSGQSANANSQRTTGLSASTTNVWNAFAKSSVRFPCCSTSINTGSSDWPTACTVQSTKPARRSDSLNSSAEYRQRCPCPENMRLTAMVALSRSRGSVPLRSLEPRTYRA